MEVRPSLGRINGVAGQTGPCRAAVSLLAARSVTSLTVNDVDGAQHNGCRPGRHIAQNWASAMQGLRRMAHRASAGRARRRVQRSVIHWTPQRIRYNGRVDGG
jgi:hypothetical protein